MKRVVVHVGVAKAASTTLQAALAQARPELSGAGAEYLAFGGGGVKDQKVLRDALADDRSAKAVRRALRPLTADTLILSGESLFRQPPAALRALLIGTPFADAELSAMAIVREPVGWLNSRYAYGATGFRRFGSFARFAREEAGRERLMDLFAAWRSGAHFTALPLHDRRDPRSVIARAFATMGLPIPPPETDVRKPAPDPRTVEAGRRVGRRRDPGARPGPARRRLLEAAATLGWTGRFVGPTPVVARLIIERTAADRDAFARGVWGTPWNEVSPNPDPDSYVANEWRGGSAADEQAIVRVAAEVGAMLPPRRGLAALAARLAG